MDPAHPSLLLPPSSSFLDSSPSLQQDEHASSFSSLRCTIHSSHTPVLLRITPSSLLILKDLPSSSSQPVLLFSIPLLHILSSPLHPSFSSISSSQPPLVSIAYIPSPSLSRPVSLLLSLRSDAADDSPLPFLRRLREASYLDGKVEKEGRRVLLLVNPVGGKGDAVGLTKRLVLPILETAGCKVGVVRELACSLLSVT
jgi:hypothetical protein